MSRAQLIGRCIVVAAVPVLLAIGLCHWLAQHQLLQGTSPLRFGLILLCIGGGQAVLRKHLLGRWWF
jgi:hypothetical protein